MARMALITVPDRDAAVKPSLRLTNGASIKRRSTQPPPPPPATTTFSMAKNKTTFTDASVEDYLAGRGSEQQRTDCRELIAILKKATHQPPRMWGPSIVGFGSY